MLGFRPTTATRRWSSREATAGSALTPKLCGRAKSCRATRYVGSSCRHALILTACLVCALAARGAEESNEPDPAPQPLHEHERDLHHHHDEPEVIVVTATPTGRARFDLLQSSSVLEGEDLGRQLEATIGETLALEPGVSTTFFGRGASRPIIRGLGGARVRTLVDGMSTFDVGAESPDHAVAAEPMMLDRVEVLRGAGTLRYASTAVGGVVNMITERVPTKLPEHPVHVEAMGYWGSNANDRAGRAAVEGNYENFVVRGEGYARAAGDYHIPGFAVSDQLNRQEGLPQTDKGKVSNTDFQSYGGSGGLSYFGDEWMIGAAGTLFDTNYGVPGDGIEEGVRIDLRQVRADLRAEIDRPIWKVDNTLLQFSWADYEHMELEDGEVATRFTNTGYEGRLEFTQGHFEGLDGAFGIQMLYGDIDTVGEEAYLPRAKTFDFALFALQEFDLGAWVLDGFHFELGGRYQHQSIQVAGPDDFAGDTFSVSGGFRYKFLEHYSVGILGYRNVRQPTADELYSDGPHLAIGAFQIGDPSLKPEAGAGGELSLRRQGKLLEFGASVFVTSYERFIAFVPTGMMREGLPVFRYAASDAFFYGFELDAHATLWQWQGYSLGLSTVLDWTRGRLENPGSNVPRMPPLTFVGALELQSERVDFSLQAKYAARQLHTAAFELETSDYVLFDLNLEVRPFLNRPEVSLFLRGKNLLDVEAREATSFLKEVAPLPGRDIRLGASITF